MPATSSVWVNYRFIDGWHVYTSDDVYCLYVIDRDARTTYDAVAPSVERLIWLNDGGDVSVAYYIGVTR